MISDNSLMCPDAFVNGNWVGGARFAVTDPATGKTVAQVAKLDAAGARAAVDAADAAFPGWAAALPQERAAVLHRWFHLIREAREDLARIMTAEQGKPLSESRGEIDYAASFVEFYAEEAKRPNIESVTSHLSTAEMELW
ncbi:aldehyde dehydrogenase family protein, partial [uncultured Paracoccus sp.]|uniref:aldehyde dehydrogenase family protein n=1 Tax=uncultured Paracoccus sp. TaxID=189685 RepID=UPI0025F5AA4D